MYDLNIYIQDSSDIRFSPFMGRNTITKMAATNPAFRSNRIIVDLLHGSFHRVDENTAIDLVNLARDLIGPESTGVRLDELAETLRTTSLTDELPGAVALRCLTVAKMVDEYKEEVRLGRVDIS